MKITYAGLNGDSFKCENPIAVPSRLKDIVECPVCLKTPRYGAPIFQCRNGHLICRDCYKRVESTCPVCRVDLYSNTKIRCLSAEKILDRLYAVGNGRLDNRSWSSEQNMKLKNVSHKAVQCNTKDFHKREKLLEVANDLMELWIEDTRDAESRVLVITNDIQDVKKLENWINNEFDFAPHMATALYSGLDKFKMDLATKMFFYSPPAPKETNVSSDDEENPYPGIALGCCRFLVATIDEIKKLKGQESFSGKVTHVVNYDVPHDQTEYTFRVSLMSNSEKNADMGIITTIFSESIWNDNGKFACELVNLMKELGQDVPEWLAMGVTEYSAYVTMERSLLPKVMILTMKKLWNTSQASCLIVASIVFYIFKFFRFLFCSLINLAQTYNQAKNLLKTVLWILTIFVTLVIIIYISFQATFRYYPTLEESHHLYINLKNIGSDMIEQIHRRLIGR